MSDDDRVLILERAKQHVRGVDGLGRGLAFDQDVGGTANGAAFVAVEDVAVTAHAGVSRPFVTRDTYARVGRVERGPERAQRYPQCGGNLKNGALGARDV